MIYLQIHGLIHNLPLKKGIERWNYLKLMNILGLFNQRRLIGHTHLTETTCDSKNVTNSQIYRHTSPNLVNYQRNSDEIPSMETNSLTRSMMQSSKCGFFKKNIWDKYISRSIELRDKFSVKNISIVMISVAKSNLGDNNFYDIMSERLITKCQNYLSTYKVDPIRFFSEEYRSEFTPFNIYTILSACSIAKYENEKLFRNLFKVSEIKLYYFNKYIDRLLNDKREVYDKYGIDGEFKKEDKFTFEDVSGILYVYSVCSFKIPQIVIKYSSIFKKMYYISNRKELNDIIQIGEVTPKAFAIGINSLVKLGEKDVELYRIGLEYLHKGLEEMSVRDVSMIFNSIFKIRPYGNNFNELDMEMDNVDSIDKNDREIKQIDNGYQLNLKDKDYKLNLSDYNSKQHSIYEDSLLRMTNKVVEKFTGYNFDPESLANISSTFTFICLSNIFKEEELNHIKIKFNKLFEEATCMMIVNNESDNISIGTLVQLLYSSSILGNISVCKILLTNQKFKTIGLIGSKLDVLQYLISIVSIYNKTNSKSLKELIEKQFTISISQYGKRLNYILYPNTMGLSKTKAKPADLYSILKLEAKGLVDEKITTTETSETTSNEINKDWKELTKELSEFTVENISHLGSILNMIGKFNQCKDYTKFVSLSCDYFIKFFKLHYHELDSLPLEIETISSIVHTLSKYRIKNKELMEKLSKVVKCYVDKINETKDYKRINYLSLFNIINSYSKLGIPENGLFKIRRNRRGNLGKQIKLSKRNKQNDIHNEMFKSISGMLGLCDFEQINLQMLTNCLYSLSLVGFDKFNRSTLVRLLDRFIEMYPKYGLEKYNRNTTENKDSTFVSEYLKGFEKYEEYNKEDKDVYSGICVEEEKEHLGIRENRGSNELKSQVNIIRMMIYLMVKNDYFKSRVFQNYWKRICRVMFNDNEILSEYKNMKIGRKMNITKGLGIINNIGNERSIPIMNKMSGFHRNVLTVLKKIYKSIRSEVCWKKGTYYVDIVIRNGKKVKFIEIDGPYHYYLQTTEMVSSTKAKDFIISNYGNRLIHLPYYEWAKLKNEDERIKYLRWKLNRK